MCMIAEILAASYNMLLHVQNPDQERTRTKSGKLISEISGVTG